MKMFIIHFVTCFDEKKSNIQKGTFISRIKLIHERTEKLLFFVGFDNNEIVCGT